MSSYVVKEREWDTESVRSGRQPQHYTTVRRYKVPDRHSDTRSERVERIVDQAYDDDRRDDRRDDDREEIRIVRRETRGERDDRDVVSYRISERDRSRSHSPVKRREEKIIIRREESRSPSPEPVREREIRYERDDRYLKSPYELERYSKSTEYFSRPEPQPIIIRESAPQPIIIREEAPRQEVIVRREERERSPSLVDVVERKSVINEETAIIPAPPPPQEDYYYERVTREVDRPRQRRYYEDDREKRRERERDYNSDDDVRYVRREVQDYEVRDESPHTKRHLAEGAIAGLGAAALMRHQRKRRGEDPGHRGRQAIGYAAMGAVGAEALSRAKKRFDRSRSRSRSVEEYYEDRDGRRHGRHRSKSRRRSRSQSHSRRNTALAVAGIAAAAAAAYAAGKRGNNNTTIIEDRRSRSRHRANSVSGVSERSLSAEGVKHVDPEHRNRRIAQAGLAGAALAGLAQHQRSKSRGRSRSKSKVRQAAPIIATGLGSAAVAGLYEKFRGNKERKRSQSRARELSRERSLSRSRSRSRSVGRYDARHAAPDAALIEYGGDPIYTRDHDRHHRSRSLSSGSERHRRHSRSRSRSRSRARDLATGAAVAGVTGLAVNEARKRREQKKADKERRRKYFIVPFTAETDRIQAGKKRQQRKPATATMIRCSTTHLPMLSHHHLQALLHMLKVHTIHHLSSNRQPTPTKTQHTQLVQRRTTQQTMHTIQRFQVRSSIMPRGMYKVQAMTTTIMEGRTGTMAGIPRM